MTGVQTCALPIYPLPAPLPAGLRPAASAGPPSPALPPAVGVSPCAPAGAPHTMDELAGGGGGGPGMAAPPRQQQGPGGNMSLSPRGGMERRAAGVLRPPRERVPRQAQSCPGRSSTLSQGSCTTSSTSGLGSRWSGRTGRWSGPNCRYLAGVGVRDGCGGGVPGRGVGGWGRDSPQSEPEVLGGREKPTCAARGAMVLATALPLAPLPPSRRRLLPSPH